MIAQHSSKTNEHYTPTAVVEAARTVLGGFDLDPASCAAANETIRATTYHTLDDDGLNGREWHGRVFLNPPGGILRFVDGRWIVPPKEDRKPQLDKSSMFVWWQKLVDEYVAGRVVSAVFVGFTLEILRLSQAASIPVQAFPRCYPRSRLRFGGSSPTHANVLAFLPGDVQSWERFKGSFDPLGFCERGAWEGR